MCKVSSPFHCLRSDFVPVICRKFKQGRFLVIGADPDKLGQQFAQAGREAAVSKSYADLAGKRRQGADVAHFEIAVWFYPSEKSYDDHVAEGLSRRADEIVLVPAAGAEVAERRPQLVESFRRFGLLPDYQSDLSELHPGALRLQRGGSGSVEELIPAVEAAFARLNTQLSALQRSFQIRRSELEAGHRHIAAVEEKLLKLKEYRRELKLLREQRQQLRKAPERRVGQLLLAPYRLPEKLVKTIWKKLQPRRVTSKRLLAATEYQKWLERHRASASDLNQMRSEARAFAFQPLVSVVTPVFDTPVQHLEEAVESVVAQAYENWELLLVDDGSSAPDLLDALPALAARDRRITLGRVGKHEGISAASNQGLALARGEWVTFLDHDDVLEPDALFQNVRLLQEEPEIDLIYSDEDKLSEQGFDSPLLKPDWSPDLFLSYNYLCHMIFLRQKLAQEVGAFRSRFDGSQDYDLLLRVIERTNRIAHIPRVLYHWRRSPSSSASNVRQKPNQLEASRLAIEEHMQRCGEPAHVTVDWRIHAFCVRRELLEPRKIAVVVPNCHGPESLERCIESLTSKTSYSNYEIIIVHGDGESPELTACFSSLPYRQLRFSGVPSDSAIKNFALEQTDSPWLLFLDDNIEVIEPDWLTIMAEHVQRPEVGAVGARLLNPEDTIQHAGFVLGVDGITQPAFYGFPAEHPGVNRQLQITRNCSAVCSACMFTRREVFQEIGGFDEALAEPFADVDLCLRMRRAGYLIVYTPFAKLYRHAALRDRKIDMKANDIMRERWSDVLQRDPYYNPNFSRDRADFSLDN
jgi:GT2 family glycosyltransferase